MVTVSDPVCGMQVDPGEAAAALVLNDQEYYFCSEECKDLFEQTPSDYVADSGSAEPVPADEV